MQIGQPFSSEIPAIRFMQTTSWQSRFRFPLNSTSQPSRYSLMGISAYAGTLHDPIISVDLVDFQRPFFLASGQVGKPGQYDLRHETTVSEGIAIAGGLVPSAKTQVFLFHRVSTNWVEVKRLNLKDILHGKNVNEDAYLSPGDMIFVPEKFIINFRKYVPYSISGNAGTYITPN